MAIGSFDGLHLGHRALVERVIGRAKELGAHSALLTFQPHPRQVLSGEAEGFILTPWGEKGRLLAEWGLELLVVMEFTRELSRRPAEDFLAEVAEKLGPVELWCGPDFALGWGREAGPAELAAIGEELGFRMEVMEPLHIGGQVVSSSLIRTLLVEGRVGEAAKLLGRPPSLAGVVVAGDSRGRVLGFPTANLELDGELVLPGDGVYAVRAVLPAGSVHPGVANLGRRPSFDGKVLRLEVHLLDFQGGLYGMELKVDFIKRLREERRFASPGELAAQVARDIAAARIALSEPVQKG